MKNSKSHKRIIYSSIILSVLFTGCSIKPEVINESQIKEDVKKNLINLNRQIIPVSKPISLEEAINRAVNYNLTKKVEILNAALAKQKIDVVAYEALPELAVKAGYERRDNYAASASTSFENGQPASLGSNPSYSISQDRTSQTSDVGFSWNILDFGLSYVRAQQQSDRYLIAKEKEEKAKHSITQQVREAYYKAVSADELLNRLKPIMIETRKALDDSRNIGKLKLEKPMKALSYQRELLEVLRSLHTLEENLVKSKIELSELMGLRPGTKFELSEKIKSEYTLPTVNISLEELETLALENRPELQETRYKERISSKEIKKVMLELLPGINLNAGLAYSDNEYLLNNEWTSYGASISWNLLNVFNTNIKKKLAKTQVELAKQQKLAVSMAIVSQVHMSMIDLALAKKQYKVSEDYYKVAEEIYNIIQSENNFDMNGKLSLIKEKLNYLISNLRLASSYAKVQNAYGKVISSVGVDNIPEVADKKEKIIKVDTLEEPKKKFEKVEENIKKTQQQSSFEKRYLKANQNYYSIHIASLDSMNSAEIFVLENKIKDNSISIETTAKKAMVMYGIYKNYEDAKSELENLSETILSNRPIIRRVSSTQILYKKNNLKQVLVENYSISLGVVAENRIDSFINKYNIDKKMVYSKKLDENRYELFWGKFATKEDAMSVTETLHPKIKTTIISLD